MGTTPQGFSTSAALLFTEQELGGPCTEVETYPLLSAVDSSVIAQGNGDRVGLIILNIGSFPALITLAGKATSSTSISLPPSGGSLTLTVRDDFTLTSRQWSGVGNGGVAQLYVLEIIRFISTAEG